MKDQHEGEPQSGADPGKDKPTASIHYLDEWRAQHPRCSSRRADSGGGRKRRGAGTGSGGSRRDTGKGYGGGYGRGNAGRGGYGGYGRGRPGGYGAGYGGGFPGGYFGGYARSVTGGGGLAGDERGHAGARSSAGPRGAQSRHGRSPSRPVSSIHGGTVRLRRSLRPYVVLLTLMGVVALLIGVFRTLPSNDSGPVVDPPTILRIWFADARERDNELVQLLNTFGDAHGVEIEWRRSGSADGYELIHAVLVGPAPDVIFVDGDMGARLLAMDALLELFDEDQRLTDEFAEPTGTGATYPSDALTADEQSATPLSHERYMLQLAEETIWVRSLRAAIPRQAGNPDVARLFVAFLADTIVETTSPSHSPDEHRPVRPY